MKSFAAFYVICTLALVVRAETEVDESISADPKPGDLVDGDLNGDKDLWDWKNEDLTNQIEADSENSAASQLNATRVKRNLGKVLMGSNFIRQLQKVPAPKVPAPKVPAPAPKVPAPAPKVPAPKVPAPAPKVPAPKVLAPAPKAPGNRLPPSRGTGPSGKPTIHNKQLPNRKTAQEAAREAGKGNPPIHHGPSNGKNSHFHPADKTGRKLPDGSHYSYPKKG